MSTGSFAPLLLFNPTVSSPIVNDVIFRGVMLRRPRCFIPAGTMAYPIVNDVIFHGVILRRPRCYIPACTMAYNIVDVKSRRIIVHGVLLGLACHTCGPISLRGPHIERGNNYGKDRHICRPAVDRSTWTINLQTLHIVL